MKSKFLHLVLLSALPGLVASQARAIDADLGRFVTAKQEQIRNLSRSITNKVPALVWSFFDAVRVDDWETASNLTVNTTPYLWTDPDTADHPQKFYRVLLP
jgi:hypothetical protein